MPSDDSDLYFFMLFLVKYKIWTLKEQIELNEALSLDLTIKTKSNKSEI